MSKPGSAAPDVDLASNGISGTTIIAAIAVVCGFTLFFPHTNNAGAVGGEAEELAAWDSFVANLWLIPWAILRIVQLVVTIMGMLLAMLIVKQRSILYVPTPPGAARTLQENPPQCASPSFWGLPYEDVNVVAADGTVLHAWLIYQPLASCKHQVPYTFVYFHGNAGNIGHRLENICDMHTHLGINILIVDYRGYGNSEDGGGPTQDGFMMDAMATYEWLVRRIENPPASECTKMSSDRIIIFGRSIGGCVGICLAARLLRERNLQLQAKASSGTSDPLLPLPAGIVLENSFTSLREMAVTVFPFLKPLWAILRSPLIFDEWRAAEDLEYFSSHYEHWCCCMLSGLQDQIVPPVQMRQLHEVLKRHPPKVLRFHTFPHGSHNDTPTKGGTEYWTSLQNYLAAVNSSAPERRRGANEAAATEAG